MFIVHFPFYLSPPAQVSSQIANKVTAKEME